MKEVVVYHEETKEFVETGNRRWGADLLIRSPYEEGFEVIYEDESDDGESWKKEFELNVKNKVWLEVFKWGAALERYSEEMFVHKDVLNRGFTDEELRFVNAYRNRFVVIRIAEKNAYIYDNETKEKYRMDVETYHIPFKKFKQQLKQLNLI